MLHANNRSHQTVRLVKGGSRGSPGGVCVMELASMLGGGRINDHPSFVCPVIAAFLRGYNDGLPDGPRQHLRRWSAASVGTRTWNVEQTHARGERVLELVAALQRYGPWRRRVRAPWSVPAIPVTKQAMHAAGLLAAETVAQRPEVHDEIKSVLAELCGNEGAADRELAGLTRALAVDSRPRSATAETVPAVKGPAVYAASRARSVVL